jgi:hypothetical protein
MFGIKRDKGIATYETLLNFQRWEQKKDEERQVFRG